MGSEASIVMETPERVSVDFEIMLYGKLVVIDGINFFIRDGATVFLDCPICEESFGLSVFGSHLAQHHRTPAIRCPARKGCPSSEEENATKRLVAAASIQEHMLQYHSRICCKSCKKNVNLTEVEQHISNGCSKSTEPAVKLQIRPASFCVNTLQPNINVPSELDTNPVAVPPPKEPSLRANRKMLKFSPWTVQSAARQRHESDLVKKEKTTPQKGKIPTVPCPYCNKQCTYLNKHIRDVHQPKVRCEICNKLMGKSYLPGWSCFIRA